MIPSPKIAITGANGFVGSALVRYLSEQYPVRALTRSTPHEHIKQIASEVQQFDAREGFAVDSALKGIRTAYYLIHSMKNTKANSFVEDDRIAAHRFGQAAKAEGVERIIYLGGLTSKNEQSAHLRSRAETAEILQHYVPQTIHVQAAMIVGATSASFLILQELVDHLPLMICPSWVETKTQPIAIKDVVSALAKIAEMTNPPTTLQLGGPEIITYREMMQIYARVAGKRPPRIIDFPSVSPKLSAHWIALITSVNYSLAQSLVMGLKSELIVSIPPPTGINDRPLTFQAAVHEAITQQNA